MPHILRNTPSDIASHPVVKEENASPPAMFCYQCEMSTPGGCGSDGQTVGTCLKDANLARLQDIMLFGLKGLAAMFGKGGLDAAMPGLGGSLPGMGGGAPDLSKFLKK